MNRRRNSSLSHRSSRAVSNAPHGAASVPASDAPLRYNECQEAVEKLTEYLSHELIGEQQSELQAHLQECHGCFEKFQFEETVLHTIRARMGEVSTPAPLRDRILSMLDAEEMAVH